MLSGPMVLHQNAGDWVAAIFILKCLDLFGAFLFIDIEPEWYGFAVDIFRRLEQRIWQLIINTVSSQIRCL